MNIAQRKEIAKKLMDMVVIGSSVHQAAIQLNIPERTAYSLLESARDQSIKQIIRTADGVIAQFEEERRKRIKYIWDIILDEKSKTRDVIRAIELLQKEEDLKQKRMQQLGILYQDPVVTVQQNMSFGVEFDNPMEVPSKEVKRIENMEVYKDD